jgi:hypothetical protein
MRRNLAESPKGKRVRADAGAIVGQILQELEASGVEMESISQAEWEDTFMEAGLREDDLPDALETVASYTSHIPDLD